MSKAKSKAKQVKGKIKETAGEATDDQRLKAEGTTDRLSGKVEETAEKAADQVKKSKR